MLPSLCYSQDETQTAKKLTIGDKVPDLKFEHVLNYKKKTARLSDFKSNLIILDFLSTWCSSCIAAFPKMDELQKKFGNKLQVLLVNPYRDGDNEERIKNTFSKLKVRTGFYPSMPIPIHDTLLNTYFPRQRIPHLVWIDGSGTVVAITDPYQVTVENIQSVIDGKKINLPVKDDYALDVDKPLLAEGDGKEDKIVYRSVLTSYIPEIGSTLLGVRKNDQNEIIGMYMHNIHLFMLLRSSYTHLMFGFNYPKIILDVKNPEKFKADFEPENAYCYDITVPPVIIGQALDWKKYLREDIKRVFNITVYKEKRKINCFVVSKGNNLRQSKFKNADFDLIGTSIKKYIHNYSVPEALSFLDRLDKPLINETGISQQNIDIDFPDHLDLSDDKAVIEGLKKAGFEIKEEEREIDVVVITDK